jgi:hypothetical protein
MEGTMNPQPIAPLMDAVLRTLGRHSRQDYLRLALRQAGLSDAQLLKVDHAPPYPVAWAEMGLGLVLQRLAWGDMPGAPTWGVHSVTLDAQRWKGSWPMGAGSSLWRCQRRFAEFDGEPGRGVGGDFHASGLAGRRVAGGPCGR